MVLEALPPPASTLRSDFTILEDNASVHYLNNTAKALANQQPPLAESPFHNKKSNIIDIDSYPKPFSAEDQENRVVTASSPQYAESPKTTRRIVANTSSRSPTSDQDISKVKQVVRQKRRPVLLSPNHCRPNTPSLVSIQEDDPLAIAPPVSSVHTQVEKHLTGQYDWLMVCPADTTTIGSKCQPVLAVTTARNDDGLLAYGCNLVRRTAPPLTAGEASPKHLVADKFTLIATPISAALTADCFKSMQLIKEMATIDIPQPPPHFGVAALSVPEATKAVQDALSPIPSPSIKSERSFIGAISPAGSFSGPRIEDSLEEIDKLEEELEAINEVADFKEVNSTRTNPPKSTLNTLPTTTTNASRARKRASMANLSPSTRLGLAENAEPTLRRSASLRLRPTIESSPVRSSEKKVHDAPASAQKAGFKRLPTSKSSKPPTVPKFELPGEAVARKLREQREARKLQQEQAAKLAISPPKPLTLTKPCFELPGEAISRRKREEREAKLKAEEEEARKRREFKARPVRHSIGPNTLPRETATSRARAAQTQQNGDLLRPTLSTQQKRMSIGPGVQLTAAKSLPSSRSSLSSSTSAGLSRQSTADSKTQGVAPTITTSEAAQKALRRKSTFLETIHDTRQRERQEKEKTMKEARAQAAERSRIASREWAEKQRRRESSQH